MLSNISVFIMFSLFSLTYLFALLVSRVWTPCHHFLSLSHSSSFLPVCQSRLSFVPYSDFNPKHTTLSLPRQYLRRAGLNPITRYSLQDVFFFFWWCETILIKNDSHVLCLETGVSQLSGEAFQYNVWYVVFAQRELSDMSLGPAQATILSVCQCDLFPCLNQTDL